MALPALVAGSLGALLSRWWAGIVLPSLGIAVVKVLGFLGLALATNEWIVQPGVQYVKDKFLGVPADFAAWLGFFRIDVCVTMLLSAYVIGQAKRVFLTKR